MQFLVLLLFLVYMFVLVTALFIIPYLAFAVQKDNKNTGFWGRYNQEHTFTLPRTDYLYNKNFFTPLLEQKLISAIDLTEFSFPETPDIKYQAVLINSWFGKYTIVLIDTQTVKVIGRAKYQLERGFSRFSSTKWCFVSLYHIITDFIHSGFITAESTEKIKKYRRIFILTLYVRVWIWVISLIFIFLLYLLKTVI